MCSRVAITINRINANDVLLNDIIHVNFSDFLQPMAVTVNLFRILAVFSCLALTAATECREDCALCVYRRLLDGGIKASSLVSYIVYSYLLRPTHWTMNGKIL